MSNYIQVPHASLSSPTTQTVISTAVAYPVLFEDDDDVLAISRRETTVSINSASPCTVTCIAPATTILSAGTPIRFTVLSDATKGIALATTYYITNIAVGAASFQLSSTIALARAGTANINTTGAITGTYHCISRMYVSEEGDFEVIVSALLDSTGITGATAQTMDFWFVKGNSTSDLVGTNIVKSNTQASTDRAGVQLVVCVALLLDLDKNDFIRMDYRGSDTRIRWLALPAVTASGTTPAIPACPSIILTIKKVCR
jgi:hypothetical protein